MILMKNDFFSALARAYIIFQYFVSRSSVGLVPFPPCTQSVARMCNLRQTGLIPFPTSSHPREETYAIYRPVRHFLYAGTDTRNI